MQNAKKYTAEKHVKLCVNLILVPAADFTLKLPAFSCAAGKPNGGPKYQQVAA